MSKIKVMVAMSGGVDSSLAAYLLLEAGFHVTGVTMCIGSGKSTEERSCCSPRDIEDAQKVSRALGIDHYVFDYSDEMEKQVISPFIRSYREGKTPNPCVICNARLKFGSLLRRAMGMGFDFFATGHYAAIRREGDEFHLERARDRNKDQTYFLYNLSRESLKNIIFPLADYSKDEVREISRRIGLPVGDKPDSQDVCFFPAGGSIEFFQQRGVTAASGDIVSMEGAVIGRHQGIIHYTVGQRRGIGISSSAPLYVISIDAPGNRIVVGNKNDLGARALVASGINFFSDINSGDAFGKIRYAHKAARCAFTRDGDSVRVEFDHKQEAVTPGQSVVLYSGDRVLGGGIIDEVYQ